MSTMKDSNGAYLPHFEARTSAGTLAAVNAELVHNVSGDESAVIYFTSTGTLNATYAIEGSFDGFNYFAIPAYPLPAACFGGTIPMAAQPLITEAVNVANAARGLCLATGCLRKIRIRLSAYTSGNVSAVINSEDTASINPYIRDQKASTLFVTGTAAVSTALNLSIPAVPGLRHYIVRIAVVRSATAALTASATPVAVTTTNLPGPPVLTFGSDAAGIGIDKEQIIEFGSVGLAATAINTATTIACPLYTGVIWRVNIAYRLGL